MFYYLLFFFILIVICTCIGAYVFRAKWMPHVTGGGDGIEINGGDCGCKSGGECDCKSGGNYDDSDSDDEIEGGGGIPFRGKKGSEAPKKLIRFNNRLIEKLKTGDSVTMIACMPGLTGKGSDDRKKDYTVAKIHRYDSLMKAITAHKNDLGHPEKSSASDVYDKDFKQFYGTLKEGDKFAYIELK